jgi:fatty acid/phospholipid biosynthesis enzyme
MVLISHGRSDARAIMNALLQAAKQHRSRVMNEMAADVQAS